MSKTSSPDIRDRLLRLGYRETSIQDIQYELETLFKEIDFDKIKQAADYAKEANDTIGLISTLKELMLHLENKGYYRPDFPTKLIKLLVIGLNVRNEDIFAVLDKAGISLEEKRKEKEFLASCAAITQLGYILLSLLVSEVKAASSGAHVFIIIDSFSPDSMVFVDFSMDSVREIDVRHYDRKENCYYLKNPVSGLDGETSSLLTQYYYFFHVSSHIGLSHNIHNNLGIAYDKVGMYEAAIEEQKEALRLDPGYIEVHNNLAVTYSRIGMLEEAIQELEAAIRLKPEYTEAHCNLGNIYAEQGRYDEAIGEQKEALRLNPAHACAYNSLGNIYALQNKKQEAIKEFQRALKLSPDYAFAHSNLGNIYSESGLYEEALKELQEAIRLEPESSQAYYSLGFAYYNLGSYERAAQAFVRAACLAPEMLDCVPDRLSLKVRQGVARLKANSQ